VNRLYRIIFFVTCGIIAGGVAGILFLYFCPTCSDQQHNIFAAIIGVMIGAIIFAYFPRKKSK
jgi:hypothetical protein